MLGYFLVDLINSQYNFTIPMQQKPKVVGKMSRKAAILKLHDTLVMRREALRNALAGDLSLLKEMQAQSGGDEIDAALDSAHNEINSQLAELESRELAQVEEALARMKNGTYGICEATGKPIPLARLQALPYAIFCIEAQRELEKHGEFGTTPDWSDIFGTGVESAPVSMNDAD